MWYKFKNNDLKSMIKEIKEIEIIVDKNENEKFKNDLFFFKEIHKEKDFKKKIEKKISSIYKKNHYNQGNDMSKVAQLIFEMKASSSFISFSLNDKSFFYDDTLNLFEDYDIKNKMKIKDLEIYNKKQTRLVSLNSMILKIEKLLEDEKELLEDIKTCLNQ